MKKIAIVKDGYIRNAQIYTGDPAEITDENQDWENNYSDMSFPCQFIGIFEGASDEEILELAAKREGVHPDIISLIDLPENRLIKSFQTVRFVLSDVEIINKTIYQLYDSIAAHLGIDISSVKYDCTRINIAANIQDEIYIAYEQLHPAEFARSREDATTQVTMMLARSGPKADHSLPDNTVEMQTGFFIWEATEAYA